jgi:hypothetical protein
MAWEVVRRTFQITMSKEQYNQWEVSWFLVGTFQPPLDVLTPGYGQIYKILCGKVAIRQNMKLHLGTLQLALAWILLLWFQGHWGNGGNDYHVNTCTMYYNMSCFVGSLKISFISQLGVAMKFVACWLGL